MEKKIKLIAVVLGALCLGALGLAFSYITKYNKLTSDYQQLEKEKQDLHVENNRIAQKASKAEEEVSRLKEREAKIQQELDRLGSERDDLQSRYDKLSDERDKLLDKLEKALDKPAAAIQDSEGESVVPAGDEYWAGVLRQKEDLQIQLNKLKDTARDEQINMNELTKEKTELNLEIEKLTKEKDETQRKLEYNEKMADTFSLQLVRERDDKRKMDKQLKLIKEENYALRGRLKEVMSGKISLERRLKDTEDKRLDLYNRLSQMDLVLQDKLSAVLDTKQDLSDIRKGSAPSSGSSIELSPIVVQNKNRKEEPEIKEEPVVPDKPATEAVSALNDGFSSSGISGKVREVNAENGFVVLDVGQKQGVKAGDVFGVYRDSREIARIEVIKTSLNVSAADIKTKNANIQPGDTIR